MSGCSVHEGARGERGRRAPCEGVGHRRVSLAPGEWVSRLRADPSCPEAAEPSERRERHRVGPTGASPIGGSISIARPPSLVMATGSSSFPVIPRARDRAIHNRSATLPRFGPVQSTRRRWFGVKAGDGLERGVDQALGATCGSVPLRSSDVRSAGVSAGRVPQPSRRASMPARCVAYPTIDVEAVSRTSNVKKLSKC